MGHPVFPLIIHQFYLVHFEKISYVLSCGDERDGIGAAVGAQALLDDGHEEVVGVRRLLAALHQQSVGRGDREGGHLQMKRILLGLFESETGIYSILV